MEDPEFSEIKLSSATAVAQVELHIAEGRLFVTYKEHPDRVQPTRPQVTKMLHTLADRMTDISREANLEDRH